MVENPKFFGSYYGASYYISDEKAYIKKFSTSNEILLLNVGYKYSNDINNFFDSLDTIKTVCEFYSDVKQQELLNILKYSKILINILFGTSTIIDIDDGFVIFLKDNNVDDNTIKFIIFIIKINNSKKYEPSRISVRSIEKPLTLLLKYIFIPFKIDGLICNNMYNSNSICHVINKLYKNADSNTCVPTEICIFNPKNSLKFIKFVR